MKNLSKLLKYLNIWAKADAKETGLYCEPPLRAGLRCRINCIAAELWLFCACETVFEFLIGLYDQ